MHSESDVSGLMTRHERFVLETLLLLLVLERQRRRGVHCSERDPDAERCANGSIERELCGAMTQSNCAGVATNMQSGPLFNQWESFLKSERDDRAPLWLF